MKRIYLDYNACAPLLGEAHEAMLGELESQANASSVHYDGRNARATIEKARSQLGALIGAASNQIVFTSGASEAATHALSPIIKAAGHEIKVAKLLVSAVEHPAILSGGRFLPEQVSVLGVNANGLVDIAKLDEALKAHDPASGSIMVAVQYANNETGIIQPLSEIARLVHDANGFLVVDAVQALGKVNFNISDLSAHFVILSSHKIGGPQGAGALVFGDASISPKPLIGGGGQENYQRGGTENTAAIAGFGAACEWATKKLDKNSNILSLITEMRDNLENEISSICLEKVKDQEQTEGFQIFGKHEQRLPNTSCFSCLGIEAQTALISLDLDGISVSSGSACSSGKVNHSHVLKAMGVSKELAACALRVSLGAQSSKEDVRRFVDAWRKIVDRISLN